MSTPFQLLFQKAGKRTLSSFNVWDEIPTIRFENVYIPNIIYCYNSDYKILLVVGVEDQITSIGDLKPDSKIYGFNLPNMVMKNFKDYDLSAICLNFCKYRLYNVQNAAMYFLNSAFSSTGSLSWRFNPKAIVAFNNKKHSYSRIDVFKNLCQCLDIK